METFIGNVAQYILDNYKSPGEVCIVMPNRRAGLFLKKALSQKLSGPAWSPAIFSIEDFVFTVSGYQPCDQAEMLLALYRIVCSTKGHEDEPFDGFCKWAPALLADFAEADLWLADPKKLFTNLTEIKHMEHWSLGESQLTDFQKKYLRFWDQLAVWYDQLRSEMVGRGKCWSGLAHRLLAENLQDNEQLKRWNHYVFAGFNALSASQDKILSALVNAGRAKALWDVDRYYMEDPLNEAGHFLRTHREKYFKSQAQDFPDVGDHLAGSKKEITLIAAARNVSQARAAASFLDKNSAQFKADETAVVLADEQLLIPMLNAMPAAYTDINITMGYPLRNTPVYTLVNILFSMQEGAKRFNVVSKAGELKFYHHDVIRLLRHPYMIASASDPSVLIKIIQHIAGKNLTFISPAQLISAGGEEPVKAGWFTPWKDADDCIAKLQAAINLLRSVLGAREENALDLEYLYRFHLSLNRITTLTQEWKNFSSVSAVKNLLLQVFGSSNIPFTGEPLAGLQIMGMLETRCLDFKNVIIVSANEGVLPGQSTQHSFIMYDLRRAFNLPVHQDRDALAAYQFYRLLQRAENICLVYNTDQDTFGVKEKSRFVSQLVYELPKVNKNVSVHSLIAGAELNPGIMGDEISIPSSPEIVDIIKEKAAKGFSPSLINIFRECRLRFYLRYVAGLYEQEEVEESVDQNALGTIMHTALELLYGPFLNVRQTTDMYAKMRSEIPAALKIAFGKVFPHEDTDAGKNHLAKRIAERYLQTFLDVEMRRIQSQDKRNTANTTVSLEDELSIQLNVSGVPVLFKGNADRIDEMDSTIRLIDYKTGEVKSSDVVLTDLEKFTDTDKHAKAFQLLMYAWLYIRSRNEKAVVMPSFVSFRKLKQGYLNLKFRDQSMITAASLKEFEETLFAITGQILSPSTVFTQTGNQQQCRNCEFNEICRR